MAVRIDRGLRVVALLESARDLHDVALGISEVALRLVGRSRRRSSLRSAVFVVGFLGGGRLARLGFQRRLGLADLLQTLGLVGDPLRQLVSTPLGTKLLVLRRIFSLGAIEPLLDFGREHRLHFLHPLVAHRLVLGGVGADLGSVQRHVPKLDQAGLAAQRQHLLEQSGQRFQVPLAKITNRPKVRPAHRRHGHEVQPLLAALRDPARGVHSLAVRIEQQRRHHHRMVRRIPSLLVVALQDSGQIQALAHHPPHEVRQVIPRHKLFHGRRQQEPLIGLPRSERLCHHHLHHHHIAGVMFPTTFSISHRGQMAITRTNS